MKLQPILSALLITAASVAGCGASGPTPEIRAGSEVTERPVMTLRWTTETNQLTMDPIWVLSLKSSEGVVQLPAVTGRASRQQEKMRRIEGSKAPLPRGSYQVGLPEEILPGDPVELGRSGWISLEPLRSNGRTFIGIHHDPSYGKLNGESGTDGCIGMISAEDMVTVVNWVNRHRPATLVVVD